ncbi:MAG TPA: CHRD domain-containing protein [Bacteroidota bacterium]
MNPFLRVSFLILIPWIAHGQIHFTATLDGTQEVPPVVTTASGTGSFTLSDDFTQLKWVVSYQGLSGTLTAGGHFHVGQIGVNGPVVKNIASGGDPASNTISGTWTSSDATQPLTPALVESLLTGRMYVNFHTAANPGGEIRGQVNLATSLHFTANLTGAQENPPITTTAGGTGSFVLNPQRTEVQWVVTYRDLSGTLTAGGHFHVADSGRNGPIVKNIASGGDPASNTISGVWASTDVSQPLTPALVDSLIVGKLYVNFHTATNPGGQIRGQVKRRGGIGFTARYSGQQENPPVATNGSGTGAFSLNAARTELSYDITYINLSGTLSAGGHFHSADSGRNGPVVRNIASGGDPASNTLSGVWRSSDTQPLTQTLLDSLLTGRIYTNFHTTANPGGEIRGQLQLATGIGFSAKFSGTQEVPPVASPASGTLSMALNAARADIRYDITYHDLSGTLTAGGHFHVAGAGRNGPIVKNLASGGGPASATIGGNWTTADATQPLTRALVDSLITGLLYSNFHTAANPGGEIRAQALFGSDIVTSVDHDPGFIPREFSLHQNYPNPFNPSTSIRFDVATPSDVTLKIYDVLGREVAVLFDGRAEAGSNTVTFDAQSFASGVYFYRAAVGQTVLARKMVLVR